jgi:hypothetical protein
MNDFSFDHRQLMSLCERYGQSFRTATPFPHVVLDDFLPDALVDQVLSEFPRSRRADWTTYDNENEVKLAVEDETRFGPSTRHLLHQFNSSVFLSCLECLTGIDGLIPDPHFCGGGLHQIERGGFLNVHADFNWYPRLRLDRRLNLILYLNKDWTDEYRGHLELWNREMSACERRILPVCNRCVIFATTDYSYHGHPDPLTCPVGWTRKSLALYYYSNGRPDEERSQPHSTLFKARPGASPGARSAQIAKKLTPPIVLDLIRRVRDRRA